MNPFRRRALWLSTLGTAITGLIYFGMRQFLEPVNEWAVIHHPLEPWVLKAHILVAPVMVFSVGMVAWDHIWGHLRSGLPTGRKGGIVVTAVFGPLVLTGYLIQAVTHPGVLAGLSWSHLGLGIICFAFLASHRRVLRKRRILRSTRLPVIPRPVNDP